MELVLLAAMLAAAAWERLPRRAPTEVAAVPAGWRPAAVVRVYRPAPTVLQLGGAEARRLLLHPAVAGSLVLVAVTLFVFGDAAWQDTPASSYHALTGTGSVGFYPSLFVFLGACWCAGRSTRYDAEELLTAAPATRLQRTLGSCLAAAAPFGVGLALVLAAYVSFRVRGVATPFWPGPVEMLNWPLTLLGAGTLGVMVSRWLPWRGMPLVVMVVLVAVSIALSENLGGKWITYFDLVPWEPPTTGYTPPARSLVYGHAVYLLGLDLMAVVGAVLRDDRRLRWWLLGAGAVLIAIGGGVWQA